MEEWVYIQSNGGTAPETWRAGTSILSIVENQTAHSSASNTNQTDDRTEACQTSDHWSWVYGPGSYNQKYTGDTTKSIIVFHHFSPSTATEFVGSYSDSDGTHPAATITNTLNYTLSTVNSEHRNVTWNEITGDTTGSSGYSDSSNATYNGTPMTADTDTTTHYSQTRTINGATTFIGSYVQTVGEWTTTTAATVTDTEYPYYKTFWTTSSGSFTVATNSTQTKTSSSTWTILVGTATQNTTATTDTITTPVTYAGDHTTVNALTSTVTDTDGSTTYTTPATSEVVTLHAFSQKIDTVLLMHGFRNGDDFNLGDMLWSFSLAGLGESASSQGRLSNLFASNGNATITLADYEKYSTNAIAITAITVSQNTVTTSTVTTTGTGTATATASTGATIMVFSKNGAPWAEYDSFTTTHVTGAGTSTGTATGIGISAAASNYSTVNHTFSIGDVSTSVSTWSIGTGTYSTTVFYHTIQVTGYDTGNFSWTSTTETAGFFSSSFSETRLALWSSTTTSMDIVLRSTTTDAALINSYSSYMVGTDTSYFFLGQVSTATTRVYTFATTTSQSLYDSKYNVQVDQYTTMTRYSLPGGGNGETYAVMESFAMSYHTKRRLTPQIRTSPDGRDYWGMGAIMASMDKARFSVLPQGYAGFGGSFDASTLAVYFTVEAGLVSGNAFSGQSVNFGALPTVAAYPGVTLFPVDPLLPLSMPGAARASYVAGLASIGAASLAVTWTSTTTATTSSGTASKVTSRFATYTLAGVSAIGGTFFSEENLTIHNESSFQVVGGYGLGDNNLGHAYTVFARSGYAQWTEYSAGQSTASATFSTSGSNGTVSFTVAGNKAIVFQFEPIFTCNWTGDGEIPFYFSSTPHVRLS